MLSRGPVYLRLLESQDLPKRVEWINDPKVNEHLNMDVPTSLARTEKWLEKIADDMTRRDFSVFCSETDEYIGFCGLTSIEKPAMKAEHYIAIGDEKYRGSGYGPHVYALLMEYGFKELGLNRIYGYQPAHNTAAHKAVKKLGWRREGLLRQDFFLHGTLEDRYVVSILRDEWLKLEGKSWGASSSDVLIEATPLVKALQIGKSIGIDLLIKRDDLYSSFGGGNKARMVLKIAEEIDRCGCDSIVTTGGVQSNHARAAALIAAEKGWKCKLVLHGDPELLKKPTGNLVLACLSGADIEIVDPSEINPTMKRAFQELQDNGFHPYEIPGGGHCLAGGVAYIEALEEVARQCDSLHWKPNYIVLASGNGTTQAGLICGVEKLGWDTSVIGISAVRPSSVGARIVEEMCQQLFDHLDIEMARFEVDFRDEWIGEGYERASQEVLETISWAALTEGIILDPTYTGKAFTGMLKLVESGEIERGSKVLFWHTGGLLNLLSAEQYVKEILRTN